MKDPKLDIIALLKLLSSNASYRNEFLSKLNTFLTPLARFYNKFDYYDLVSDFDAELCNKILPEFLAKIDLTKRQISNELELCNRLLNCFDRFSQKHQKAKGHYNCLDKYKDLIADPDKIISDKIMRTELQKAIEALKYKKDIVIIRMYHQDFTFERISYCTRRSLEDVEYTITKFKNNFKKRIKELRRKICESLKEVIRALDDYEQDIVKARLKFKSSDEIAMEQGIETESVNIAIRKSQVKIRTFLNEKPEAFKELIFALLSPEQEKLAKSLINKEPISLIEKKLNCSERHIKVLAFRTIITLRNIYLKSA